MIIYVKLLKTQILLTNVIRARTPAHLFDYRKTLILLRNFHECALPGIFGHPIWKNVFKSNGHDEIRSFVPGETNAPGMLRQTLVNQIRDQRELVASMEPLAAFLTVHLLRIVEALHRCHIIHGDIKPDNILITGL